MQNQKCKIAEVLTEELLKITDVHASYTKELEKERHLVNCQNENCSSLYKTREELGLNENSFEQYSADWESKEGVF